MTNAPGLRVLLASGLVALAALLHGAHAQDGAANTRSSSSAGSVDGALEPAGIRRIATARVRNASSASASVAR